MKKINKLDFEKAMELVKDLDFTLAIEKLQTPDAGAWTQERAEKAVEDYKRYLAITKALDGYQLVPNGDIDEIWHYHILDTRQYVEDCYKIFGGFLHHYPYFGMIDEENKKEWLKTQETSQAIWEELFDEELYSTSAQKCPQMCPCRTEAIKVPQKCPQMCPCRKENENNGIDQNYRFVA